ncbi:MAG: DUF6520 family protein [Saonia sp.]
MKTNLLSMLISAFAFILAIAASFATLAQNRMEEGGPVQQGYIHTLDSMQPCQLSIKCDSSVHGLICTTSNRTQVWGKETPGGTSCSITLYGAEY